MNTEVLTGLRFWAAAIVVIFHFGRDSGLVDSAARGFLTSGPQMVGFFFVLSGFIMAYVYLERPVFRLGEYYVARFARVVPVYILALCFLMSFRTLDFWQLISDFTLLKAWFPQFAAQGNFPGWSISVEVFFYLLFPFILVLLRGMKRAYYFAGLAFLFWAFSQVVLTNLYFSDFYSAGGKFSHGLIFYFPVSHLSSFVVGIATAFMLKSCAPLFKARYSAEVFLVFGVASAFIIYFALNYRVSGFLGFNILSAAGGLAPIYAVFIFSVVVSSRYFKWLLANKVSVALGEASYAFYILQLPVFLAFNEFIVKRYSFSRESAFCLYFLTLLIVSVVVFYFLERPARDLINRSYRRILIGGERSYSF